MRSIEPLGSRESKNEFKFVNRSIGVDPRASFGTRGPPKDRLFPHLGFGVYLHRFLHILPSLSFTTTRWSMQPEVFSSGYLVFRLGRPMQFLLMRHTNRWDLPKGHVDTGETAPQAALRELRKRPVIKSSELWTDPDFVFRQQYTVSDSKKRSSRIDH